MPEKTAKKEKEYSHIHDFYSSNNLTINSKGAFYRNGSTDKEIYTKNIAGTEFKDNYNHRLLSIIGFVVSIIFLIVIRKSSLIPASPLRNILALLLVLTCIITLVSFILMRDEIKIYSTSSSLSIHHKIKINEHLSEIQSAIDKAVEYAKSSKP